MKKTLYVIGILIIMLTIFTSCSSPYNINIGHDGFMIGRVPPIEIGIKSDTIEFDIDDATMDFSFGNENGTSGCIFLNDEECPIVGVAVYFYNEEHQDAVYEDTDSFRSAHFEDYKEIENWYFVKDIRPEDFNANYKIQYNYWGHTKYDHTETLTIPKEIFIPDKGTLYFAVYEFAYIPSENTYISHKGNTQELRYEVLNNGKVRITSPGHGVSTPNVSYTFSGNQDTGGTSIGANAYGERLNFKWKGLESVGYNAYELNEATNFFMKFYEGDDLTLTLYTANYRHYNSIRFQKCIITTYDYNETLTNETVVHSGGWFKQIELPLELNKIYLVRFEYITGDYVEYTFNTKTIPGERPAESSY